MTMKKDYETPGPGDYAAVPPPSGRAYTIASKWTIPSAAGALHG